MRVSIADISRISIVRRCFVVLLVVDVRENGVGNGMGVVDGADYALQKASDHTYEMHSQFLEFRAEFES